MRDIVDERSRTAGVLCVTTPEWPGRITPIYGGKGYRIVKEIIMKDMGKMYTAFVAVRSDCVDTYGDNASYSIHSDDALL